MTTNETESPPAVDGFSSIVLERVGRYESGQFDEDAAEILAYNGTSDHALSGSRAREHRPVITTADS